MASKRDQPEAPASAEEQAQAAALCAALSAGGEGALRAQLRFPSADDALGELPARVLIRGARERVQEQRTAAATFSLRGLPARGTRARVTLWLAAAVLLGVVSGVGLELSRGPRPALALGVDADLLQASFRQGSPGDRLDLLMAQRLRALRRRGELP